jgi:hypothetical protein
MLGAVNSVIVYCASSNAVPSSCLELADEVGRSLAQRSWTLIYGGGSVGMMGRCADQVLAARGRAIGVITTRLVEMEVAHTGLTELRIVETMHERKVTMTELGDAFLVLPGGFGTLDETFEAITWKQLGMHSKPIVLLNADGFFDPLLEFLRQAAERRFIRPEHLGLFTVVDSVAAAMQELESPAPWAGTMDKWWRE